MGNKNFIEINGKKYDAVTGKMLDESTAVVHKPVTTVTPAPNTGVVDGFSRRPSKSSSARTASNPAMKKPTKSQTLMRNAVHKPEPVAKKIAQNKPTIHKSQLGTSVKRTQIAKQTPKSQHVQKYGEITHRTSVAKTSNPNLTVKNESKPQTHPSRESGQSNHNTIQHTNQKTSTEKMLDSALENAHAHESVQPAHNKKRGKLRKKLGISTKAMGISSAVLAAVLLGGFFAIQNVPNLSMRVAATRAGFDATMPGYQPSGFSFKGPIKYSPGQVTITFKSNTDDRTYDVKQQASNWNSDALLANYVVAEGNTYQTYLDRGRTLYIYNGSNATWVDDGVWYQIEGESNMTTDQLIRIAASI